METQGRSNRREFLRRSAVAAAAVGASGGRVMAGAQGRRTGGSKPDAVLRLSIQEGRLPGKSLAEKLDLAEKWGFEAVEPSGRGLPDRVEEFKKALAGRPLKMSAVCAGFEGWLIAPDKETREKAVRSMKEILAAAGELGAVGLIMVPAFNRQPSLPHKEARELLTGFPRWDKRPAGGCDCLLGELGEYAARHGTCLILEPLNRKECYFLRTLADAASMCKDVEHPGVRMMGDFWHMTWEETSDRGAILSGGPYLKHIHIASRRRRKTPGEDGEADNYVDGFKGLKEIGYRGYVSFECGCAGDPMERIPAAVELLRRQWEQA